jgi:hypothetical protein
MAMAPKFHRQKKNFLSAVALPPDFGNLTVLASSFGPDFGHPDVPLTLVFTLPWISAAYGKRFGFFAMIAIHSHKLINISRIGPVFVGHGSRDRRFRHPISVNLVTFDKFSWRPLMFLFCSRFYAFPTIWEEAIDLIPSIYSIRPGDGGNSQELTVRVRFVRTD